MSIKKFIKNNKFWLTQVPKDINGLSVGGDKQFACMKNHGHACVFWLFGNLAADATIGIQQARDIGGRDAKAYTFDEIYKIQTSAGDAKDQDKAVAELVNATTRTVSNTAEDNYLYFAEIEAEQLDVNGGFDCLRPFCNAGSGATLVAMGIIFTNARYQGAISDAETFPSVLAGEQEQLLH